MQPDMFESTLLPRLLRISSPVGLPNASGRMGRSGIFPWTTLTCTPKVSATNFKTATQKFCITDCIRRFKFFKYGASSNSEYRAAVRRRSI